MAEYYPLLSKAVSGLRDGPPEKRQAIYDRARQALLGQLRSMEQANEDLIERERLALDEAIARVEAELMAASLPAAAPTAATSPLPRAPLRPERPSGTGLPPRPTPAPRPSLPAGGAASAAGSAVPPRPYGIPPRPALSPRPVPGGGATAEALATPAAPPATQPRERIAVTAGAPALHASRDDESTTIPSLPAAPTLEVKRIEATAPTHAFDEALADAEGKEAAAEQSDFALPRQSDTPARPTAPRHVEKKDKLNPRILIVACVAALVVAGIGYTAWRLRDRPEMLAKAQAARQAAQGKDQQPGKINNRIDGASSPAPTIAPDKSTSGEAPAPLSSGASTAASTVPSAPQGSPSQNPIPAPQTSPQSSAPASPSGNSPVAASNPPAPQQNPPPPVADTTATPAPPPAQNSDLATAAPASPTTVPASAGVPVSQRAAFLVEAPDQPSKLKTYVGTVVWSTDNVSPGGGQPLSTAVRAEVDIPDAHLKLTMLVQKNFESQFPASHTIELRFAPQPGNTLGDVKQIEVPQLRKDGAPLGDPLAGLPVTITNNVFLIGLSRGEVVARNLDLIQSRNWFDVPCRLANDKVAKITFEKGSAGDKALSDAIQSWQ